MVRIAFETRTFTENVTRWNEAKAPKDGGKEDWRQSNQIQFSWVAKARIPRTEQKPGAVPHEFGAHFPSCQWNIGREMCSLNQWVAILQFQHHPVDTTIQFVIRIALEHTPPPKLFRDTQYKSNIQTIL
mmetsp:Transcript_7955/g.17097  ORF Transcript_7955/g.17097 Transcript_7955/m.17097 type:complete len:129 (+) Transcript_7955:50-436(+)